MSVPCHSQLSIGAIFRFKHDDAKQVEWMRLRKRRCLIQDAPQFVQLFGFYEFHSKLAIPPRNGRFSDIFLVKCEGAGFVRLSLLQATIKTNVRKRTSRNQRFLILNAPFLYKLTRPSHVQLLPLNKKGPAEALIRSGWRVHLLFFFKQPFSFMQPPGNFRRMRELARGWRVCRQISSAGEQHRFFGLLRK